MIAVVCLFPDTHHDALGWWFYTFSVNPMEIQYPTLSDPAGSSRGNSPIVVKPFLHYISLYIRGRLISQEYNF